MQSRSRSETDGIGRSSSENEDAVESRIRRVADVTSDLRIQRSEADDKAFEAIGSIVDGLIAALDGEVLFGMPHLGARVFGLRVGEGSAYASLPQQHPVLVLVQDGRLMRVQLCGKDATCEHPPQSMITARLMEPFLHVVKAAMTRHLSQARARTATFHRIAALADRLTSALA